MQLMFFIDILQIPLVKNRLNSAHVVKLKIIISIESGRKDDSLNFILLQKNFIIKNKIWIFYNSNINFKKKLRAYQKKNTLTNI